MKSKGKNLPDIQSARTVGFWLLFAGLLLFFALLCLYRLGDSPIENWDEARHGVSGYEMLQNGDWIVTTYGYSADYYNLKPPLSEWCIALGYALFGYTPFGMRIYSAVAMILTALCCGLFAYKRGGKGSALVVLLGFCASGQLLFSHCARHGDADSLYILFYTVALLALCEYARDTAEKKDRFLYAACLSFSLAFLTKSWHAGCIGVLVLLYLLVSKRIFHFTAKNWALCVACAFGPIALWAALRMTKDGVRFFKPMLFHDFLERSAVPLEDHAEEFGYYFHYLWKSDSFIIMAFLVAFALPLLWQKERRATVSILAAAVALPLLLFTLAKTKLFWYIFCIFPPLILLAALGSVEIVKNAKKYTEGLLCVALPLGMLFFCARHNWLVVKAIPKGSALFPAVFRTELFSQRRIYNGAVGVWEQREVLGLELEGDLLPVPGGIAQWNADQEGYLHINKNLLEQVEAAYVVVAEDAQYCILAHA